MWNGLRKVGPIDGEVAPDALDEVMGDDREERIGGEILGAASERVVEGGLLLAETQLLMPAMGTPKLLGDLDETLDHLSASELAQLVAVEQLGDLVAEELGLGRIRSGASADLCSSRPKAGARSRPFAAAETSAGS
jgi:hypothetical protein